MGAVCDLIGKTNVRKPELLPWYVYVNKYFGVYVHDTYIYDVKEIKKSVLVNFIETSIRYGNKQNWENSPKWDVFI